MKYNVIKFTDGKYALMRKSWDYKEYRDKDGDFWWHGKAYLAKYCKTTEKRAEELYEMFTDEGIIVK